MLSVKCYRKLLGLNFWAFATYERFRGISRMNIRSVRIAFLSICLPDLAWPLPASSVAAAAAPSDRHFEPSLPAVRSQRRDGNRGELEALDAPLKGRKRARDEAGSSFYHLISFPAQESASKRQNSRRKSRLRTCGESVVSRVIVATTFLPRNLGSQSGLGRLSVGGERETSGGRRKRPIAAFH